MNLRKPSLPSSWYPRNPAQISRFLDEFTAPPSRAFSAGSGATAAAAPHAGWYYSGALAAQAVAALAGAADGDEVETVAVIGGHLPQGMPALIATEDAAETPFGPMEMDRELGETFANNIKRLQLAQDRYQDNTVEVLLPMVRYFFPRSRLLWLRFPADIASFEAGGILAQSAASLGRNIKVLGSTDLTHYGPNYGFAPKGKGRAALEWVKTVNDRRFIEAVTSGDAEAVLERAESERSSCSAGAILGAMGYAVAVRKNNSAKGELLAYATSADVDLDDDEMIPDSFVGYGAFLW
jgi:AmmeMemoRadiSam system protein B